MIDCIPSKTPLPIGIVLTENDESGDPEIRTQFQQIIGSLLYGMIGSRPDISFAVIRLARYSSNPSFAHLRAARHIMRYIKGTLNYSIKYDGDSGNGLIGYSDADWAENKDDRHSMTGFIYLLANGAISWVTRRQPTPALSSTESEYMALSDSSCHACWLRTFISELGYNSKIGFYLPAFLTNP